MKKRTMVDSDKVKQRLAFIKKRKSFPAFSCFLSLLKKTNMILENENPDIRPYDSQGLPGGIIFLHPDIKTILVPDLHARFKFIYSLVTGQRSETLILLAEKKCQIVCLGDGLHSEGHITRWLRAYDEYRNGYKRHRYMDEEMISGLKTMEMIMYLKTMYPDYFHYLKGNHDNIANEKGHGNYPFYKYADEGAMVAGYMMKIIGEECFHEYYRFEKNLPLLAVGKNFIASHAEPSRHFIKSAVIEYRSRPDVTGGLTWTDNNAAQTGSVMDMLRHYIKKEYRDQAFYFGGHRPVAGNYSLRANGRYVQIHNPKQFTIAVIEPGTEIAVRKAVRSIP
ncbi:MAG: metallophosphoesterase [Spirochaetales bacterium]|nr:metallophosphoesterase [Spirochaetales bacterium]